eukprot:15357003-Ditylum_brightwellii.AAC.1
MTRNAPTVEEILADFPHLAVPKVSGKSSYNTIHMIYKILQQNNASVHNNLGCGRHGHFVLVLTPTHCQQVTGHIFMAPLHPEPNPTNPRTLDNRFVGGAYLQFTTELWEPTFFKQKFDEEHEDKGEDTPDGKWLKQVKVVTKNEFPFLDMKMNWTMEGDFTFNVFNKKKQAIKYVDKGSAHHPCAFKSINTGVYTRLGNSMTKTPENAKLCVDNIFTTCRSNASD